MAGPTKAGNGEMMWRMEFTKIMAQDDFYSTRGARHFSFDCVVELNV